MSLAMLQHDPSARLVAFARTIPSAYAGDAHLVQKLRDWIALSDLNANLAERVDELSEAAFTAFPMPMVIRAEPTNPYARVNPVDLKARHAELVHTVKITIEHLGRERHEDTIGEFERQTTEIEDKLKMIAQHEDDIAAEKARNGHDAVDAECGQSAMDMSALEREVAETPAAGFVGMLVKLTLANQWMGFVTDGDADHDNRLIAGVALDLERLSGVTIAQLLGQ